MEGGDSNSERGMRARAMESEQERDDSVWYMKTHEEEVPRRRYKWTLISVHNSGTRRLLLFRQGSPKCDLNTFFPTFLFPKRLTG